MRPIVTDYVVVAVTINISPCSVESVASAVEKTQNLRTSKRHTSGSTCRLIMAALFNIRQAIFALWFLSIFFLFSSPNLSGRRLDVYHTSTHGVALARIWNAGLKCAARGSLQMQDPKKSPKIAICAPSHNFGRLYLRNSGTYRQSEKTC